MYITFLAGLMVGATVGLVVFSLLKAASKETPVRYGRSLPETYHTQPPKEVPRPVDADDRQSW